MPSTPAVFRSGQLAVAMLLGLALGNALPAQSPSLSAPGPRTGAAASRAELEKLNPLIGEWRGIGQRQRGSAQGAWKQTGQWIWDFSQPTPSIRYQVTDSPLMSGGDFRWNAAQKQLEFVLQAPDGTTHTYGGNWEQQQLVLSSAADSAGIRRRVTLTSINDQRLTELHEQTQPHGEAFRRVAEIGYTRAGTHLAAADGGGRQCIVTGGAATSTVTYRGKAYAVCCSGCRQAFEADPEGILAAYQLRLQQKP